MTIVQGFLRRAALEVTRFLSYPLIMTPIKHPKDFYTGLMYAVLGFSAILIARDYNMGTSVRMGPGYFPTLLGVLLLVTGVLSMVRGLLRPGGAIEAFSWKSLLMILGSTVLFGLTVRGAGLIPSLILLVLVSACASEEFRLKTTLILALISSTLSALVFVKWLGLPFAIIGPWFGGV